MIRLAINGFGRIGRNSLKVSMQKKGIEVVAVNDLTDTKTLAHLLKYDTSYGRWNAKVGYDANHIIVGKKKIRVLSEREPIKLPWKKLKVDVVLECTGIFRTEELARPHLAAGAKRVIISAPAKGGNIPTHVMGVNETSYDSKKHAIINNASCTTNCIAPVAAVIHGTFGVLKAMMTTIHGYTADQNLQDGPHKDLRRARAAAMNIVPTDTGAAVATTQTIPELSGLFDGISMRVPVAVGSIADFTFLLAKKVTVEQVNNAIKKAAKNPIYKGVLSWTEDPIVSSDIIGSPYSSIVDLSMTMVVDGNMLKIVSWYDNEWGYSNRLVEMAIHVGKTLR
ncbi:MAG TPA: type I glyceraldehyde-3-phosphate dehydrogenase [Patescibacteria group bacterium]|nr:type I glyceraldehyde-3-phosphate dehydrogenase [Patescibacteria group bacterium]